MPPEPQSPSKLSPDCALLTSEGTHSVMTSEDTHIVTTSESTPSTVTSSSTSWQEEEWEYDLGQDEDEEDEDEDEEEEDEDIANYTGLHIVKAAVTGFTTLKRGNYVDFVFVVEVTWSDKTTHAVKRTYSDFQHFHYSLVEEYARTCNRKNSEKSNPLKLGYYLPGQINGKGDEITQAEQRELQLNQYVQELIKLPPKVSACPLVLTYFESRTSDPKPYKGAIDQSKEEVADQYVLCWIQDEQAKN